MTHPTCASTKPGPKEFFIISLNYFSLSFLVYCALIGKQLFIDCAGCSSRRRVNTLSGQLNTTCSNNKNKYEYEWRFN